MQIVLLPTSTDALIRLMPIYKFQIWELKSVTAVGGSFTHVIYPGCLIENINSLALNNWQGSSYAQGWNATYTKERGVKTSGGFPRLDLVSFTYHHVLAPLADRNAVTKEIEIHRVMHEKTWGNSPPYSKGFFPAEMSFSERLIPILVSQGLEWVIVADNHISRACAGYPYSPVFSDVIN